MKQSERTRISEAKAAGDIVKEALERKTSPGAYDKWKEISLSIKLADVASRWEETVGAALARKSSLASFEKTPDGVLFTVNVSDAGALAAARFRTRYVEKKLTDATGLEKVTVRFQAGSVKREYKTPRGVAERHARVAASDEEVSNETARIKERGVSDKLAEKMARVKLLLEKIEKKKNRR